VPYEGHDVVNFIAGEQLPFFKIELKIILKINFQNSVRYRLFCDPI
jgi:hypothetical protein